MTDRKNERAYLIELDADLKNELDPKNQLEVQFNPESLKVTYANQIVQPEGGNQASGTAGRQFVGAGTTKLSLTLWFDVTAMTKDPVDDVRRLTSKVTYFITPKDLPNETTKKAPPGARFAWGKFIFDGMVEGIEESIEYFSAEGKPLRASVTLNMSQQKILVSQFDDKSAANRPGTKPLAAAKQGDSLQSMASKNGKDGDWQGIASANGIEDPMRMGTGQFVDLNASVKPGATLGASISAGVNPGVSAATTLSPVISSPPSFNLGSIAAPKLPQLGIN